MPCNVLSGAILLGNVTCHDGHEQAKDIYKYTGIGIVCSIPPALDPHAVANSLQVGPEEFML